MYEKFVNSMRLLALHAIKENPQGHVGMSMSAAPITYTLFTKHINIYKDQPKWVNRDRFVMSAGHGSLALYTLYHFAGLISLDDMKTYKKKNPITPAHPEVLKDNYIDASTGPLGQGIAMAVGMAISEKHLENKFDELKGLIDNYTYVLVGDGDIQEGISYEAMSLAGKFKLNKLIVLHDSNDYQIDSRVETVLNENLKLRVESMHWNYILVENDSVEEIDKAINTAKKSDKPTYIEVKTTIGFGTKLAANSKSHTTSIKDEDLEYANQYFGLNNKSFEFEQEIYDHFKNEVLENKKSKYLNWVNLYNQYKSQNSSQFKEFDSYLNHSYDIKNLISSLQFESLSVPTRNYVKDLMKHFKKNKIGWIIAGSADLATATNVEINETSFNDDPKSNNIKYGIREFSMSAITNGILLYGVFKSISSTFLAFSDYMKSSIRLGALMELPNFYILTHDCYQVGADGPTHQPVDQLPMLRAIPNVNVFKPCDQNEFLASAYAALSSKNKTNILVLTRQALSSDHKTSINKTLIHGGYALNEIENPDLVLIGAGTEIDLLFEIQNELNNLGLTSRIISACSIQNFLNQSSVYLNKILDSKYGVFSVESSSDSIWYQLGQYTKNHYHFKATQYGHSMDGPTLYKEMGFNKDNLSKLIVNKLIRNK